MKLLLIKKLINYRERERERERERRRRRRRRRKGKEYTSFLLEDLGMVNILIQSGLMLFEWGTKRKRTWYIHCHAYLTDHANSTCDNH